jgi:uncharacterized protein YbbC (DUF1343 family)
VNRFSLLPKAGGRLQGCVFRLLLLLAAGGLLGWMMPAAASAAPASCAAVSDVLNGIDVLERDGLAMFRGRHVGLITNQTGMTRTGKRSIDLFHEAADVDLVAIFSPEHGIDGTAESKVADSRDARTNLPVFSLFTDSWKPNDEMLRGIDTLVFDIQDIGTRFYTYIATMGRAMEQAAKRNIRFVVLDRVNPLTGSIVEGPLSEPSRRHLTAYHEIPVRHGMTAGELACLFNAQRNIHADLKIIKIEGWRREQWFDETNLPWVNTSPNIRSLTEATLYPAIGLLENTNISVGRGTDTPFELIGAPWIDARELAQALNSRCLPGVRFLPTFFTPKAGPFSGQRLQGVNIFLTDRRQFRSVQTGIEIAVQLKKLFPGDYESKNLVSLLANGAVFREFLDGRSAASIRNSWQAQLGKFMALRKKFLLY